MHLILSSPSPLPPLPLVGRAGELEMLAALLDGSEAGHGGTLLFCGDSGVGKSRLLRAAAEEAERRGWKVALGRAYPVESGVPYAPFADALLPLLRALSPEVLTALTRGSEAPLAYLFPALPLSAPEHRHATEDPAELKTRVLWGFARFLGRLAERQPLLLILEDLQWADASSLELLHFVARQIGAEHIALLGAYHPAPRDAHPRLRALEQSLASLGTARIHSVQPLSQADASLLIREVFQADEATTRDFVDRLYHWTQGNPFFLEELLKALVGSGRLRREHGTWLGWELRDIELPRSVRDAVLDRLAGLDPTARSVAELLAVIGTSTTHEVLRSVSELADAELLSAVDQLREHHVVVERLEGSAVIYDFAHPLVRETLYAELGLARARLLHARTAAALEAFYGSEAPAHSDELALHYARAHTRDLAPKAVQYLTAAGRSALGRYAAREAADYLSAALERTEDASPFGRVPGPLLEGLARARQRLGEFDAAIALWERVRDVAAEQGDAARLGACERRIGLALYWSGRYQEALEHLDAGLEWARRGRDAALQARIGLGKGECLQELGRPEEARREIEGALEIARSTHDDELLARVHLALLLLHTWMGPPERARAHGEEALRLAERGRDPALSGTVHWGLAVLAGLTGDAPATAHHVAASERIADQLDSPLHRLRIAEPAIEFASSTGDWETALAMGEQTIAAARALNQRALLARLLVWTGLIHLGRGDVERGRSYLDEAWELSRAGHADPARDVHSVVPAHCGRAAYHVATGEYAEAVRVGLSGLEIADRTGYTVWAIHRLLPVIAEAYLSMGDVAGATRVGARLRRDSQRLGHLLGLAWADACDAFLVWLRGDIAGGITRMRAAAERLESIPAVPDAARLRRHFAARLRDHGQRDEALRELRRVHEIFARLGAERELLKTREQIRELGARPPAREGGGGAAGLTAREVEIARLVAEHKSNKAIGKALDISPRTVSTHLSNIFRKLGVDSRGELADRVRRLQLPDG